MNILLRKKKLYTQKLLCKCVKELTTQCYEQMQTPACIYLYTEIWKLIWFNLQELTDHVFKRNIKKKANYIVQITLGQNHLSRKLKANTMVYTAKFLTNKKPFLTNPGLISNPKFLRQSHQISLFYDPNIEQLHPACICISLY